MTTLSVIVASSGRPTLARTIESVRSQMQSGDECLVSVNFDCPWGHAARNQLMIAARGDALMFLDDDDVYVPGALAVVRDKFEQLPDVLHLFKMRYANGSELWSTRDIVCGNVSTQMVVVPRIFIVDDDWHALFARWGHPKYEGDFDFIEEAHGEIEDVHWHEEVIALVRPE